jgi:hypothetical protein
VELAGAKTVVDVRLPACGKIPMVNNTGCRAENPGSTSYFAIGVDFTRGLFSSNAASC